MYVHVFVCTCVLLKSLSYRPHIFILVKSYNYNFVLILLILLVASRLYLILSTSLDKLSVYVAQRDVNNYYLSLVDKCYNL